MASFKEVLGITTEHDNDSPGHTVGMYIFYTVLGLGSVAFAISEIFTK